ncbi:ABC transporter permease [Rugosimonospora acidiphila]|uniref:ABC transporter permease n=1 Tax=Rugosimonospora acidiphila TaxID=556531 RepID=A0ABP9SG29_9ACTN
MLMKSKSVPREPGLLYKVGLPVLGPVAFVGLWWLLIVVFHIRAFFLPAPPDIVTALVHNTSILMSAAWVTLRETLIGFAIAAIGGLLVALALTTSRSVRRAAMPVLVTINAVPKLAVAPLLVIWLGFNQTPKIVMAALLCFFPVILASMTGLISTPPDFEELARSLSASRWKTFTKVRLPGALPQVFVGLKVAAPLAVVGAVVSEISNATQGLGYVLAAEAAQSETAIAFAAVALLTIESIGLYYVLVGLERLLMPWAREALA